MAHDISHGKATAVRVDSEQQCRQPEQRQQDERDTWPENPVSEAHTLLVAMDREAALRAPLGVLAGGRVDSVTHRSRIHRHAPATSCGDLTP